MREERTERSPRNPVRVGVIGAGNVIWAYLQLLDRLVPRGLAEVGPICARRTERWPEILARRPGTTVVADPAEVLESDVDLVLVITSSDTHAALTRLALEHGKHVVVEKPFAAGRSEGEELVELASRRGLHLVAAPFVQLAPTFRALWTLVQDGAIGDVHSARGLYGNAGADWATWYYTSSGGALAELGIYNVKSLTALLGPVAHVLAIEGTVAEPRFVRGIELSERVPDFAHVLLQHVSGAVSSVVASSVIQRYRRPALELYGTHGTANLLGDDWDPRGLEIWRNEAGCWEDYEPLDPTWLWTDGLREAVVALHDDRPPLADLEHDLHVLDVLDAARLSSEKGGAVALDSRFDLPELHLDLSAFTSHLLHDHTRPPEEQ
jgi:predicted dehydrogenase